MVRQIILAGIVASLPIGLQAQGHGMAMSASRGIAVAPRGVAQAPRVGSVQAMPGSRIPARGGTVRSRVGTPVRSTRGVSTPRRFGNNGFGLRRNCSSSAPGLGFDEAHLVATCGPGPHGFRGSGFGSGYYFPFYDGGFYVPGMQGSVDESAAAETAQPDTADVDTRDYDRRYRGAQTTPAPAAETASSEPAENDQFVFVRRDGTVFFAVAYSWDKGTLRYITDQGLRHTVTQDALDLDATRQFNEQRGLNFRLPA